MHGRDGWRTGLLIAVIGLVCPHAADADASPRAVWDRLVAEGGAAPADAWPVPRGSASGSGVSAARPLTGELEVAWRFEAKTAIVGHPVIARDRVFVESLGPAYERILHVLSLSTGRESYRKSFGAGAPLRPVLIADRVIVRAKDDRIEAYHVGERMLTKRWDHAVPPPPGGDTLVHRGEVLVAMADHLVTLEPAAGKVRGKIPYLGEQIQWRGSLAARGDFAYLMTLDAQGNTHVEVLGLRTLQASPPTFTGPAAPAASPPSWGDAQLVVGPKDLFALHGSGVKTTSGAVANATWMTHFDGALLQFRTVFDLATRPTFSGSAGGWVGLLVDREDGIQLVRYQGASKEGGMLYDLYADKKVHESWVRPGTQLLSTREVTLVGLSAFRPDTRDVLREVTTRPPPSPIPVKDLLLVLEPPRTLQAYREQRGAPKPVDVPLVVASEAAVPAPLGPVAFTLEDGGAVEAAVAYDSGKRTLVPLDAKKDKRSWPIEGVGTIVARGAPTRIAFARSLEGLGKDLPAIADAIAARGWVALASDAVSAGDVVRAGLALEEAKRCDAPEADVARVEKAYVALQSKPKKRNETAIAGLESREAALRAGMASLVKEIVAAAEPGTPIHTTTTLWRTVLARHPADPDALGWARARLPKGLQLPEPFDVADALDLIESDAEAAVRIVLPPAKGQREAELSFSQKHLGAAMYHWRKDLVGIESGELLLLTPVSKPGRISHCLSLGRLVAQTLETMFAAGTKVRNDPWPLVHMLYETKEEYLRESTKRDSGSAEAARRGLEHTAGHFDWNEQVTRVFVPDRDDGLEEIRSTYAHELTHHWMRARCPLFKELEIRQGAASPGAWLDEGVADFVAGMTFDVARRRVDTFSSTAEFLDIVANAERTLDWAWLYGAPQTAAYALSAKPEIRIPLRRRLGLHLKLSPINMFYAQAAATCSYLWHVDGGKHRPAFVTLIGDSYTGKLKRGEMAARFGIDEASLGAKVVAWSRQVVNGKGP